MDDLYHQQILDLYKYPQNWGKLEGADISIHQTNASCGDSFTFYLKWDEHGNIKNISYEGQGCAISTAACSLLTDYMKLKSRHLLPLFNQSFMEKLIGLTITPGRVKCLMLPANALTQALKKPNTTDSSDP